MKNIVDEILPMANLASLYTHNSRSQSNAIAAPLTKNHLQLSSLSSTILINNDRGNIQKLAISRKSRELVLCFVKISSRECVLLGNRS